MTGAGVGAALRFPAILLSPAALLVLAPSLLADATRGPWAAVALAAGAVVVALVLVGPWIRLEPPGVVEVITARWASAGPSLTPLVLAEVLATLAFTWAQLSALRGLALAAGWWPRTTVALAAALLLAAAWSGRGRGRLLDAGAALFAAGLVLPLCAVLMVTTPLWPRVWAEVAARPRLAFPERGVWTKEGGPVWGEGRADAVLAFTEEQPVTVLGPGPIRLVPWESRDGGRDVPANTEVMVRAGDRLTVPAGTRVRFAAGRRIPGAPAAGVDWASPRGPTPGGGALAGLAVTLVLGALGLPAVAPMLSGGPRTARVGAGLAILAAGLALLWALYAVWLTPEVYAGGVAGPEVYELTARIEALHPVGGALRVLAVGGLAAGALAAGLSALGGVARRRRRGRGGAGAPVLAAGLVGGTLAGLSDGGPAVPLVLAFGLAASALAPAAALARWSERVTSGSLGAGAAVGLGAFSVLTLAGLWVRVEPGQMLATGPLGHLLAWPTLVAFPANVLVAWLRLAPVGASPRSPLPDGLAELHDEEAVRLQPSGGSGTMSFSRGS